MSDTVPAATSTTVVTPRDAATLIVLRDGVLGPEVLMGRRHANHRFMPNSLVFPGGAVDAEDYHGELAAPFPAHVTRLLSKQADAGFARAIGVALARELEEETGLTLGRPPALDGVDYLCRAITPSSRPRRFDARFFVVAADRVDGVLAGSEELSDLRYIPLRETLAIQLEIATRDALERLAAWLALGAEERRSRTTTPVMRERIWQHE